MGRVSCRVSSVARIRGDSLVVNESFGTRGLLLAPNGAVVGDLPRRVARDTAGVERPVQTWANLGDGASVGFVQRMRREYFEGVGPVTMAMPVVLTSRDGATTTALGDHPYARSGRGDNYLTIPYTPFFALGASDAQFVLGWPQSPDLRIYDAAGSLTRLVRTAGERRATTVEEADIGRDALLSRQPPERQTQRDRDLVLVADSLPHYLRIVVGADGRIWRERFSVEGSNSMIAGGFARRDSSTTWDVLAPSGEWLGVVHTPPAFYLMGGGASWIVGSFADDMDVKVPRRYRLR